MKVSFGASPSTTISTSKSDSNSPNASSISLQSLKSISPQQPQQRLNMMMSSNLIQNVLESKQIALNQNMITMSPRFLINPYLPSPMVHSIPRPSPPAMTLLNGFQKLMIPQIPMNPLPVHYHQQLHVHVPPNHYAQNVNPPSTSSRPKQVLQIIENMEMMIHRNSLIKAMCNEERSKVIQKECRWLDPAMRSKAVEQVARSRKWKKSIGSIRKVFSTKAFQAIYLEANYEDQWRIIDSLKGVIPQIAQTPFGSRFVEMLLNGSDEPGYLLRKEFVLEEMRGNIGSVASNFYGRFVVMKILTECLHRNHDLTVETIVGEVFENIESLGTSEFASELVLKCIDLATKEQRERLILYLIHPNSRNKEENDEEEEQQQDKLVENHLLRRLAEDENGYKVIEKLSKLSTEEMQEDLRDAVARTSAVEWKKKKKRVYLASGRRRFVKK